MFMLFFNVDVLILYCVFLFLLFKQVREQNNIQKVLSILIDDL